MTAAARSKLAIAQATQPELRRRIVRMRRAGMTLQAIADDLNDDGVPTARGGVMWRPSSVQSALGYKRPRPWPLPTGVQEPRPTAGRRSRRIVYALEPLTPPVRRPFRRSSWSAWPTRGSTSSHPTTFIRRPTRHSKRASGPFNQAAGRPDLRMWESGSQAAGGSGRLSGISRSGPPAGRRPGPRRDTRRPKRGRRSTLGLHGGVRSGSLKALAPDSAAVLVSPFERVAEPFGVLLALNAELAGRRRRLREGAG